MEWKRREAANLSARTHGRRTQGRTGSGKLRVDALADDALETNAGGHEAEDDKAAGIGPGGVATGVGDAVIATALAALPEDEGGSHGEEGLDEGAEGEPAAGARAYAVADAAEEGAEEESQQRGQGLLVGNVERGVAVANRALEEARERERELQGG